MATTMERLLVVQEHDCRIRDMERELKDIPARATAEQGRLDEHKSALAEAEEALKLQQAQIKELDLEAQGRRQNITKLRQQQFEIKTNREFKAMETEIGGVERDISGLEDRELAMMEELEKARGAVTEKKEALGEEDAAVQSGVAELEERAAGVRHELEKEEAQRRTAAEGIDPEWLSRYERIFTRRDRALVPLENGVCGGCHMTLPPSVFHDTQKQDRMVSCNFCGRLLY